MNAAARILVVDDDAASRRLARATLQRRGYTVVEAADGHQALERLAEELPELVLMDVGMPVMDGFTACAELRRMPGGERVPVIMLTGLDDVQSIEHAFEVGASDFITKPINWAILGHRVRYMLRATDAIGQLEENRRRLSNAQRIGEMGDWEWDLRSNRLVPSAQASRILGHGGDETGRPFDDFFVRVHPDDLPLLRRTFEQALAANCSFAVDHRIVHHDGSLRHVHQQLEVIERTRTGQPARLAGAVHDISRHKQAQDEIRRLAYYDPLTGLPNRLLFGEQLQRALLHAERQQTRAAIMFVDLDNFKRVNDTLGHKVGDELLRTASARLAASLRAYDVVSRHAGEPGHAIARLGGDEFIVLLTQTQSPNDVAAVARRLVATLAEPITVQGTEIFVGGSIGVAMYPDDGADTDTLLKNADTAMYRAKEAGRGAFRFYDPSMNARALDRLMMETRLRRALERREFVLHYQPRVDVASGRIVGAEALIRWQDPERGLLPPAEFIPLVEDVGLVIPIGEWVIEATCRQIAAWQAEGLEPVPVAVNLASTHLRERALPALVARAIREHGLAASLLEIEVTESILLADSALSGEIADALDAMGVRLSIDDFGTGYSSLSVLKRLPIAALKIDRSFVRDIVTDPDDAAIVSAIIALAHGLKLKVVAEGVETEAQLDFLRSRHCDEYQGFLTSRAVDAREFARVARALAMPRRASAGLAAGAAVDAAALSVPPRPATPAPRPAAP